MRHADLERDPQPDSHQRNQQHASNVSVCLKYVIVYLRFFQLTSRRQSNDTPGLFHGHAVDGECGT